MTKPAKKEALTFALNPIIGRAAFNEAFAAAAKKWPGVKLGYVGTGVKSGQHYFQENGNPSPFIL